MFNQSSGSLRASDNDHDASSYAFSHQNWSRFDLDSSNATEADFSNLPDAPGRSFDASSGMDWDPTPSQSQSQSHFESRYHHQSEPSDNVELENLNPAQGGGGVGRLVAHFENKNFAPPLPPRPSNVATSYDNTNPSVSSPFGSFSAASPTVTSPLASPTDQSYGFFAGHQRIASPMASPPIAFGGFHDMTQMHSPGTGPSSDHFGSMNSFMTSTRAVTPMDTSSIMGASIGQSSMAPPTMSTHKLAQTNMPTPGAGAGAGAAPGTPGFAIWRPPVPVTRKPSFGQAPDNNAASSAASNAAGYFAKPPVPSTPKPVMNAGSQLVLDFNVMTSQAKGKAPVRPPTKPPRQPTRQPSRQSISAMSAFSPSIKHEPSTPQLSQVPTPSSAVLAERRGSVSQRSQIGSRPSREQVPAEAWESLKTTIRSLYLEERKPLKEVMNIMADKYGFQATPKMYKTRFSQWGFVKNNTEDEVKKLLSMKFQRDAEGKVSEFVRNGKVVNLGTYLKRKGVTEYDLIDFETPADLPSHIRCRTPTPPPAPGYLQSPDLIRAQETVIGNMRKAFLQCRQFEVATDAQVGWQSLVVWGAESSDLLLEANHYFEMRDADQGGHFLMKAFKQLELDLRKLSPQGIKELLLGMIHRDPGMMTALCKYLAAYSSTNFERSHPLRQIFTCLYEVQQKHGPGTLSDLLWGSIPTIADELEAIYGRRHPYVARTWIDLAMFYNHADSEKLEKLIGELRLLQRQMEHRLGTDNVDVLVLRYSIVQLMFSSQPDSDATKQAIIDLWHHARGMGLVFPVKNQQPNTFCYHSPVKVDPWTKRCRRRYDFGVQFMKEHMGVHVIPYFEEDFHTTEHAPEHVPQRAPVAVQAQDSWAAAMGQQLGGGKWSFI